jgi:hypothetical protein
LYLTSGFVGLTRSGASSQGDAVFQKKPRTAWTTLANRVRHGWIVAVEWVRLTELSRGVTVLTVAGLAVGWAVVAVVQGASIHRDVDAIGGHPSMATGPDIHFLIGFGVAILAGSWLAWRVVFDVNSRRAAGFAIAAAISTVIAESIGVLAAGREWTGVAQVAGVIAISAALPATIAAAAGITLTIVRLASFGSHQLGSHQLGSSTLGSSKPGAGGQAAAASGHGATASPQDPSALYADPVTKVAEVTPPAGTTAGVPPILRARWERGYRLGTGSAQESPLTKTKEPIGIGLSGGGIRAASVMLGALQNEKFREQALLKAKYLVSVSGGGYIAGAFQQALTAVPPASGEVLRDPLTVFQEGTIEEDYLRRNSSYIARNPAEVLVALGLLARHLLLNLALLFGPAVGLGVLAGCFLRLVPVTTFPVTVTNWNGANPPDFPMVSPASWWAMGIVALLVGVSWLLSQWASTHSDGQRVGGFAGWARQVLCNATPAIGSVFWAVVTVTLGLPTIIWASAWLLHQGRDLVSVGSSLATALLTYVASLAALLWRNRKNLKESSAGIPLAAPRGFVQIMLVVLALTAVALSWLLLFGAAATTALDGYDGWDVGLAVGILVVAALLGGFVDETTLSLHPFYRRRLAKAFAVRVKLEANGVGAEPYPAAERTTLSTYGEVPDAVREQFPEIIFAASATVGDNVTPPGTNRVSYTFSSREVGGPELGYVATAKLEQLASPRLRRDLTVQGAVALSGAALAASVGAQNTKWYETLFAISGLRLGAWMANPKFLTEQEARGGRRWFEPGLPRVRRLSYLLRELFGLHPADAPLVQVTDGGFYDNLGLIELLRRRCTTIYCFDASGDNPPPAATLSEVVALAYQELGVTVDLADTPFNTTPGTGRPDAPRDALTSLNARLSESGVMTATLTYPEESGLPVDGRTGTLVVAKASLWPTLPYPLLAYAMRNPVFPNDSTADQWFDDGQYGAYTALGRELGGASVTAMQRTFAAAAVAPPVG